MVKLKLKDEITESHANISLHEFRLILIYSFRYALGRMSTAPSTVSGIIQDNLDKLNLHSKAQIISEIDYAIEHNCYGMDCDKQTWLKLRELLENGKTD